MNALKDHICSELKNYGDEQKQSIVCLLQTGALFPLEVNRRSGCNVDLRPLVWSRFNLTANSQHTLYRPDVLNLLFVTIKEAPTLFAVLDGTYRLVLRDLEIRCFVSKLMQGIDFEFRPEVYTSSCLCALECLR